MFWFAGEENGDPSEVPESPAGVDSDTIMPGQTCPEKLHELWTVKASDSPAPNFYAADVDIKDKSFATWHPIFDPCYWCAYDHEHGSDALTLVGPSFAPMYRYTAWKNNQQDEPVPGFKSFVFKYKKYMAIFDVHIQTSQPRRFQTPIHTGTFSIVDVSNEASPTLVLKLTQKLDFGPLEFMNAAGDFKPVNKTEFELFEEENSGKFLIGRVVNNKASNNYERWDTKPMCVKDTRADSTTFRVRITNTPTAIDNFRDDAPPSDFTTFPLKREWAGIYSQQEGMRRQLVINNMEFGVEHCIAEIDSFEEARGEDGVFYTDPKGKVAFSEPATDRLYQFIHPEFTSLIFQGKLALKMENIWESLYTTNDFNYPDNIPMGDAIDPTVN